MTLVREQKCFIAVPNPEQRCLPKARPCSCFMGPFIPRILGSPHCPPFRPWQLQDSTLWQSTFQVNLLFFGGLSCGFKLYYRCCQLPGVTMTVKVHCVDRFRAVAHRENSRRPSDFHEEAGIKSFSFKASHRLAVDVGDFCHPITSGKSRYSLLACFLPPPYTNIGSIWKWGRIHGCVHNSSTLTLALFRIPLRLRPCGPQHSRKVSQP